MQSATENSGHTLDGLLLELRMALTTINQRCRMRGSRHRPPGSALNSGRADTLDVSISMPEGWRTQQIPASDLVPESAMIVPSLSIEIDCALHIPSSMWKDEIACAELWVGVPKPIHSLRIDLHGQDGGAGEVRLDGLVLRKWSRCVASLAPPHAWVASRRKSKSGRQFCLLLQGEEARRAIDAFGPILRKASRRRLRRRVHWLSLVIVLLTLATALFWR